jgi:uncharacterized membrane protein
MNKTAIFALMEIVAIVLTMFSDYFGRTTSEMILRMYWYLAGGFSALLSVWVQGGRK